MNDLAAVQSGRYLDVFERWIADRARAMGTLQSIIELIDYQGIVKLLTMT